MALLEKQLVVKKSGLPGAGNGLFTKKFIPKGTRIVEYKGRITTWKEVDHKKGENGYIFYVKRNHIIDALPYKKALARYANDARGLSRVKGLTNNCEYVEDGLRVYIEAKKDIPAGAELFVGYGKDYWDTVRENIKIEQRKNKATGKKGSAPAKKKKAGTKKSGAKKPVSKKSGAQNL
jgi:SET domain-containing protein